MNTDILKEAGIDYDNSVKRFVGRAYLYEKALSKFPKDSTFTRIRSAYESGNKEQLLAGAHEFKGMCGNIGLTPLYKAADSIVRLLRSNIFTKVQLDTDYALLESEYYKIYKAISTALEA